MSAEGGGGLCGCGSARLLVRAGTLLRIGHHGEFPFSVAFAPDPFEAVAARCAGCGAARPAGAVAEQDGSRVAVSYEPPGGQLDRLPIDLPLCGCGSTGASLVLYGDAVSLLHDGDVVVEVFFPAADLDDGRRWECAVRPFGGCPAPTARVRAVRARAEANAAAFLRRVPSVGVGPEPLPRGAADGWPARPARVRSRPWPFPSPIKRMSFLDEAWLERPLGIAHAAGFVRAGFHPAVLRAVFPPHPAGPRWGTGRATCAGAAMSSWLTCGIDPAAAKAWLDDGTWPCCARAFALAGFGPAGAAAWIAAGFSLPADAAAWTDERFLPAEARAWADAGVGSAPTARACRDGGLTPREVVKWAWLWDGRRARTPRAYRGPLPEPWHLSEVLAWRAAGLVGAEARRWWAAGFQPSEALMWPPGHKNRPDEQVLASMAALRG